MSNSTICDWNSACQWDIWGEQLTNVEYISIPLQQWSNLVIIIWTLFLSFSTKLVFSLPFLMYDKSTKAKRNQVRKERKNNVQEKRLARRRLRKAQQTVLASVKMNLMAAASNSKVAEEEGAPKATGGEQKAGNADKVDQTEKPESVADAGDVELKSLDQDTSQETIESTLIKEDEEIPVFSSFDHQIVAGDNKAMSVVFGSFVLSLTYAASGSRIPLDYSDDPLESLVSFLTFSMIGYCLLCITFLATTKILLFKVDVRKALLKGNLSVAITMGGICIATSINLRVSLMGYNAQTFAETLGATVLFFSLGQVGVVFFGCIFQIVTAYDDQAEAIKGNVAAGIKWAGNLVSLAIISSSPIKKSSELASFGVFFGIGGVFLILFDQVVSRLVIPGNLNEEISKDQNWGYALIAASIMLSTSLAVDALLFDFPCPGSAAFAKYEESFVIQPED